jgi:hypothetical protein
MPAVDELTSDPPPPAKRRNVGRATALEIVVVLPPLSRFGGSATRGLLAAVEHAFEDPSVTADTMEHEGPDVAASYSWSVTDIARVLQQAGALPGLHG